MYLRGVSVLLGLFPWGVATGLPSGVLLPSSTLSRGMGLTGVRAGLPPTLWGGEEGPATSPSSADESSKTRATALAVATSICAMVAFTSALARVVLGEKITFGLFLPETKNTNVNYKHTLTVGECGASDCGCI